jgi:cell filamentation protein
LHEEVALSEFEGFLKAEIQLTEGLTRRTKFNNSYILKIHKLSLGHLYSFAGNLRDVNISKGGFPFPASRFLPAAMKSFEEETLSNLVNKYQGKNELIRDIAKVHAELLFIHPFREGNGRTARILANLMSRKQGHDALNFELITENEFDDYVSAVQLAANKDYAKMEEIITFIFPG